MPQVRAARPWTAQDLQEEHAMVFDLDDAQRAVLSQLIDHRLANLPVEIRHTDNRELRQVLRDERELLLSVVRDLSLPVAQAAGE
jgi:hypothetical protein